MSRLTRDGTAEPVSRDQILRHARGQGNIIFSVQLTTSRIGNLTRLIHTLLYVMTIHTYIHFGLATNTLNVRNNNNIPTEIQIATRSYANLQAMAPTNNKTVHQTSFIVVVVVVDSHIQRIVLATEETTVTQQVNHRPIKCQSRLWSRRGTKVNGSHHGDNPLLRPTGIQIATKSYAALQAMAPTNIKTVHQTSLLHIESNLNRLGMLSPTHDQRSQQKTGKITLQPVLINKSKFLKATHFVQK